MYSRTVWWGEFAHGPTKLSTAATATTATTTKQDDLGQMFAHAPHGGLFMGRQFMTAPSLASQRGLFGAIVVWLLLAKKLLHDDNCLAQSVRLESSEREEKKTEEE